MTEDKKIKVGVIGGSGFAGGTLLQLLLKHPAVELKIVTSRSLVGKYIHSVHPNLRKMSSLKFELYKSEKIKEECDVVFLAVPHGASQSITPELMDADLKVIDLSADYRIKNQDIYEQYYGKHKSPEYIEKAVYGMPELHREEIKDAKLIAVPGCHAASAIYALAPLIEANMVQTQNIIIDSKTGSSGSGHKVSEASHHPFREGSIRAYKMTGHRHTAEIEQELEFIENKRKYNEGAPQHIRVGFSAHGVNLIRGILSTCHVFIGPGQDKNSNVNNSNNNSNNNTSINSGLSDKEIIKAYRKFYKNEPFIRFTKMATGIYRLPDPKLIAGTNYADVGFELDHHMNRIVALCALDNLVKGAAGNAIQSMNIMMGLDETMGLDFPGIFP
ncbi:MAG: N-acetyl-gamma-glutamyl-phosphate reductase [Promethearchaeota archaeon]